MAVGTSAVESMVAGRESEFWRNRRVFLTGHTGFKGAWLSLWLSELGAEVHGFALDPVTDPNLFNAANVASVLATDVRGDIRDPVTVRRAMKSMRPEVVFHLAAQSLVRASYKMPLETLATNVMGTAHVLDAACDMSDVRAVVVVTTDKCYENREWSYPYREVDRLGGKDIYSASKASAELVTASYRASFYEGRGTQLATARAGNVIGGGDWAEDRLVPDCIRAFSKGQEVELRYPAAVRPWQHVLEPLSGYLKLAREMCTAPPGSCAEAWNFGPGPDCHATVAQVARAIARAWGSGRVHERPGEGAPRETLLLQLDSSKARTRLGWRSSWSLSESLKATVEWYRAAAAGNDMRLFTMSQIAAFERGRA